MEKRVLEIEKLKAALGETMSQEDIAKKLREKTQGKEEDSSDENEEIIEDAEVIERVDEDSEDRLQKQEEDKTEEKVEEYNDDEYIQDIEDEKNTQEVEDKEEPATFEIQMEEISPEKLAQLNKRKMEEKNGKSSINTIIYIFSFVAILLMVFAGYLYLNKPVAKEVVVYKQSEPKEIIKEVIKEKIVTATNEIDDKTLKNYFNSQKFEIYKCYDFKVGQTIFPNECKKSLKEFLAKNKDSFKLEVTAVISPDDKVIYKNVNLNDADEKIKEYILRGFSRERVLETTFYITDVLKDDTILTPVNYYVTSKKLSKGIIIKAYYLEK
ncbi:MAG: hypothetical protein ACNI28_12130 [Arcobacter sp.]|uniref:hypothetical protein n=1 Tax=Arcobacter sp. TaxID=1872629 RepID=UPI003AFFB5BD